MTFQVDDRDSLNTHIIVAHQFQFNMAKPTPILCRYHIDSVISFTGNDADGESPVYSIGLTKTSNDITLRDLLSKKLSETRSAIPFNEWNAEWKKKYPDKIFISFCRFHID